jgi:hypothetical protein
MLSALLTLIWQWRQGAELRSARRRAEDANRSKSEFLANMSHEIRTPLNGVVAMAEVLTTRDLPERDRELVDIIRSSGVTLERLLSDILDVARIEAGQVAIDSTPFDLEQVTRDVAVLWAPLALGKGVELRLDYDPTLPRRVIGDAVRLRQVLTNLISNALKFTQEGAVTLPDLRGEEGAARLWLAREGSPGGASRTVLLSRDAFIAAEVASLHANANANASAADDDATERLLCALGAALRPGCAARVVAAAAHASLRRGWIATSARLLPALRAALVGADAEDLAVARTLLHAAAASPAAAPRRRLRTRFRCRSPSAAPCAHAPRQRMHHAARAPRRHAPRRSAASAARRRSVCAS